MTDLLDAIETKLDAGGRLDTAEGEALFACRDLHRLGALADRARRNRHGDKAYYIVNRHVNYTNLCELRCGVCGFSRRAGEPGQYELSVEQAAQIARQARRDGACELHVTGGLHPSWTIDRYCELLSAMTRVGDGLHIKAFTAAEIDHIAAKSGLELAATLERLMAAGLGSLPGGGAEIFDPAVRQELFPGKISGRRWLEVHRQAHRLGLRSNATMLYGHRETTRQRAEHLLALRELQDETGGFQAFVPLSFVPPANVPRQATRDEGATTGLDDLRTLCVSRLMLDNFDHIKTFWVMHTAKLSQVALAFGADDLDGTVERYEIVEGDKSGAMSADELRRLIREAGFTPVERDSFYRPR